MPAANDATIPDSQSEPSPNRSLASGPLPELSRLGPDFDLLRRDVGEDRKRPPELRHRNHLL